MTIGNVTQISNKRSVREDGTIFNETSELVVQFPEGQLTVDLASSTPPGDLITIIRKVAEINAYAQDGTPLPGAQPAPAAEPPAPAKAPAAADQPPKATAQCTLPGSLDLADQTLAQIEQPASTAPGDAFPVASTRKQPAAQAAAAPAKGKGKQEPAPPAAAAPAAPQSAPAKQEAPAPAARSSAPFEEPPPAFTTADKYVPPLEDQIVQQAAAAQGVQLHDHPPAAEYPDQQRHDHAIGTPTGHMTVDQIKVPDQEPHQPGSRPDDLPHCKRCGEKCQWKEGAPNGRRYIWCPKCRRNRKRDGGIYDGGAN